jgi:ferrous-iron efflux pump FieF
MTAHHHHTASSSDDPAALVPHHHTLMKRATYASVTVASILILAKGAVWWISDSLAMLSSLTDSLFDIVTSIINMLAVRYALKPADEDHQFGHTGIEDIAGLTQFVFIVGAMLVIVLQSIERLYNPEPLDHAFWGIAVSGFGVVITSILVAYQTYVARRTGSLIIASDRAHYASDIIFNLGVMLAFGCTMAFGVTWADPVFAIGIAVVVLWATRDIGMRAFNNLMNREMPEADRARILDTLSSIDGVITHHSLKTRYLGTKAMIQVEVGIARGLSFEEAHTLTHSVEERISGLFASAEVMVHPNPV